MFLVGMAIMTDGLKAMAGDALHQFVARFTSSPTSGALTGALTTALVQSSSATSVATVGMVGAGVLTFAQSLGVLFGANIGTTVTGWMVATIGLKLSLGDLALPLVFIAALARIFSRPPFSYLAWALAGFALIILGIDLLADGMRPLTEGLGPESLPVSQPGARLALVGMGIVLTVITQSSSVGVALALTALHVDAISFPQAAALVIGMDVGSTSTTALATIGGSTDTKRTGWSHVVYNGLTALGALAILDIYAAALEWTSPGVTERESELSLVGFHTLFNLLGIVVVLPFTTRFAAMMERFIPERESHLARRLDRFMLRDATGSVLALWTTVDEIARASLSLLARQLTRPGYEPEERQREISEGLVLTRRFADDMRSIERSASLNERYVASLHCLDHIERLLARSRQRERLLTIANVSDLEESAARLGRVIESALAEASPTEEGLDAMETPAPATTGPALTPIEDFFHVTGEVDELQRRYREQTLHSISASLPVEAAIRRLDASRWVYRTAYHVSRLLTYMEAERTRRERADGATGNDPAFGHGLRDRGE
jgi:phosphate:Na+ symporter